MTGFFKARIILMLAFAAIPSNKRGKTNSVFVVKSNGPILLVYKAVKASINDHVGWWGYMGGVI